MIDSLIFDMDGTLWDATDSYVKAWNEGLQKLNLPQRVSRAILDEMMGWESYKVYKAVIPTITEESYPIISETINRCQDAVLVREGGKLYEGVLEGLAMLSTKYKLFILSNCPANTIKQMMAFAKIEAYITDEIAHGSNHQPKYYNIDLLTKKHQLQSPVYVGDTESDQIQSQKAGIPFYFVSYGFGKTNSFAKKFDRFQDLTDHFM